jgi:phosphoserine phosphatase
MDVLPKLIPPCTGYDLAAYSLPAEQTGGDIYDLVAVALDDNVRADNGPSLVLLLADATGHGVGPALSVTQVRAMLRIGVRLRADLDNVLAQINRQLCQDLGAERFVTAFLGLLDPSAHVVNYQSAGQGPLLHFRARDRKFFWLDSSMLPLGIDENPGDDSMQRITLEPGDLVVLLTDGFYEFQNAGRDQFGKERVAEVILNHHHKSAREMLAELLNATRAFASGAPQLDDMTALIIKRLPATT